MTVDHGDRSSPGGADHHLRVPLQLLVIALIRTVLYTGHRMVYPFLPAIARGLGITLETAAVAVTIRSALGVFSPILGAFGDIRGRKRAMMLGVGCFIAGSVLVAFLATYAGLLMGLILAGAGLMFFDPAIQAYVGDEVAYERRALGMAAIEFGWSGAFLLGVPLVGIVIERGSWHLPFWGLAGVGLLGMGLLGLALPGSKMNPKERISLGEGLKQVLTHPPALVALGVTLTMITGARNIMIVYGAWFERSFGMSPENIGLVSSLIGVAGIAGLVVVGILSDRLGKKLSMVLGLGVNLLAALALPIFDQQMVLTVTTLFVFFASFEFSVVTMFSLISELRPQARATLMAFNAAALSGGDAIGSFVGSRVFRGSIAVNSAVSGVLNLCAILMLLIAIRLDRA